MKQLRLMDVPKDSPTHRERLDAIKREFGIETHDSEWTGEMRWLAAHMPSCRKLGYGVTETSDLFDCVSKVCRLMDESGCCDYGETEREAIRQLIKNLDLPIII